MFTQRLPGCRLARFVFLTAALCALSCSPGAEALDAALHLLLDAAPTPQTFKIENDIYSIVPK